MSAGSGVSIGSCLREFPNNRNVDLDNIEHAGNKLANAAIKAYEYFNDGPPLGLETKKKGTVA